MTQGQGWFTVHTIAGHLPPAHRLGRDLEDERVTVRLQSRPETSTGSSRSRPATCGWHLAQKT
jgi:hypothetical protein